MSKHTSEPWVSDGYVIYFPDGMGGFSLLYCPNPEATARRIVACVNACRGLDTSGLESKGLASAFGGQLLELDQQRDELLKAIDRVINGTLLDSAGNRDEDGMISPWADASSISRWIKILSEAAGKAKGVAIMWIDCNSSLPTADDADSNGDVFWLRSGVELLGSVADGVPVDATHWRPTGRGAA